jgi:hypothetical protein
MYTMDSKDDFVFVDFSFIQYLLLFVTNITCNLFKATKWILVVKTSQKCVFLLVILFDT